MGGCELRASGTESGFLWVGAQRAVKIWESPGPLLSTFHPQISKDHPRISGFILRSRRCLAQGKAWLRTQVSWLPVQQQS